MRTLLAVLRFPKTAYLWLVDEFSRVLVFGAFIFTICLLVFCAGRKPEFAPAEITQWQNNRGQIVVMIKTFNQPDIGEWIAANPDRKIVQIHRAAQTGVTWLLCE